MSKSTGVDDIYRDPVELYPEHLEEMSVRAARDLDKHGLDAMLISAGDTVPHYRDDGGSARSPSADFAKWVGGAEADRRGDEDVGASLLYSLGHNLLVDGSGEKPKLFVCSDPSSPWYQQAGIPEHMRDHFDLEVGTRAQLAKTLMSNLKGKRVAGVGRDSDFGPEIMGLEGFQHEPAKFLADMDKRGVEKTRFEVAAIYSANENTARGHESALQAFLKGESEGEIALSFARAARERESFQSFPPIVAIGPHGAILHYEGAGNFGYKKGKSLVVDAGTTYLGQKADVTTTFLAASAHPAFKELVHGLDKIQRELVSRIAPGLSFNESQRAMQIMIGQLLLDVGVLKNCTAFDAAEAHLTHVFCPHSIGHSLGVRGHDRGNAKVDEAGNPIRFGADFEDPILVGARACDDYSEDSVMTVEPGIYFISGLLNPHRNDSRFNWSLIDQLEGGARIETDIWVTRKSLMANNVDLTRLTLPRGTNV